MAICDQFSGGPSGLTPSAYTLLTTFRSLPATATTLDITASVIDGHGATAGGATFAYRFYDATSVTISTANFGSVATGASTVFTLSVPALARYVDISATAGSSPSADLVKHDTNVNCSSGAVGYCAYGTRPQGSTTAGVIISTALIDAVLVATGVAAWVAIVLDAFIGKTLWSGDLCGGLPPAFPHFDNADFIGQIPNVVDPTSRDKWWTALLSVTWPYFCECVPGPALSTPAVPPPTPAPIKPDAAPDSPVVIACDNTAICAALEALARQLLAVSRDVNQLRTDVTLVQRQGVPFGYVYGPIHSALTGHGHFAVADILGLAVTFTTLPGSYVPSAGDPTTYHQLGKISVGTVDGWERSWQPTHSPYMILPVSGAVTKVGWSFSTGIVAAITELIREP